MPTPTWLINALFLGLAIAAPLQPVPVGERSIATRGEALEAKAALDTVDDILHRELEDDFDRQRNISRRGAVKKLRDTSGHAEIYRRIYAAEQQDGSSDADISRRDWDIKAEENTEQQHNSEIPRRDIDIEAGDSIEEQHNAEIPRRDIDIDIEAGHSIEEQHNAEIPRRDIDIEAGDSIEEQHNAEIPRRNIDDIEKRHKDH